MGGRGVQKVSVALKPGVGAKDDDDDDEMLLLLLVVVFRMADKRVPNAHTQKKDNTNNAHSVSLSQEERKMWKKE